jgi:cold shock CspA family protein
VPPTKSAARLTDWLAGYSSLAEGAKVTYEVVANRGKESAENLKLG